MPTGAFVARRNGKVFITGNSGMPKAGDVSKSIDARAGGALTAASTALAQQWTGYSTTLKPAFEPACLARKPLDGIVAANVERWGVGALAIDACRIDANDKRPAPVGQFSRPAIGATGHTGLRDGSADALGRWPANVLLDPEAAAVLDEQSGIWKTNPASSQSGKIFGRRPGLSPREKTKPTNHSDTGGASRFFYVAKASSKERNLGCKEVATWENGDLKHGNVHSTVKPIELCRYLARLIKPPVPRRILVPFSGSGSEMIGCLLEGWPDVVGIEREAAYVAIARARLDLAARNPMVYEGARRRTKPRKVC